MTVSCYPSRVRLPLLMALLVLAACGDSPSVPTPPSSPPPSPPAAPSGTRFNGRLVATVTGEPIDAVDVDLGGLASRTGADGRFSYQWSGTATTSWLSLTAAHIVPRGLMVSATASRDITVDAIALGNGFALDYYKQLVRNSSDAPDLLQPLRRWTKAPMIYLKTVDEAGRPIDSVTLDTVAASLADEAAAWTGARFGIAGIERGVDSRVGVPGWLTVRWPAEDQEDFCGRAQVGTEGGWMELNYLSQFCDCLGSRMAPGIVRHELGHSMGFYHTNVRGDVMMGHFIDRSEACGARPSARERFHAAIAYSRPVGNYHPDNDRSTTIHRGPTPTIVIVD